MAGVGLIDVGYDQVDLRLLQYLLDAPPFNGDAHTSHDRHFEMAVLHDGEAHLSLWAKRWRNLDTFGPTTIMQ